MSYLNTASEQKYASTNIKQEDIFDDNASLLAWSQYLDNQTSPQQQQIMDVLGGNELDMSSFVDQSMLLQPQDFFAPFNVPPTIKEEWPLNTTATMQHEALTLSYTQQQQFMMPPTPPVNKGYPVHAFQAPQPSREITPPSSTSASGSNSPNSSDSTPPPFYLSQQIPFYNNGKQRRRKSTDSCNPPRTYRRRASSHPSVASVVSLSAHEPIARVIEGIEHITFLYSHDRLVKEYTVRTDVDQVNLCQIPLSFRLQNAIYPRANVSDRSEYEGNRWEYETSCNKLGWELCWLNQDQLAGRRGLIQRAVDSYRNRHAEMRSRRVTRQEKVANGTLRKRRAKKANSAIL